MKENKYETKNGEETKTEYKLEKDDLVVSLWDYPNKTEFDNGNITKYSLMCIWKEKEIFLSLTEGQYKYLKTVSDEKPLKGANIEGRNYKNKFGEHVGIKVTFLNNDKKEENKKTE